MHRYPDRVLFLATGTCSTYCRYCTRSRLVGNPGGEYQFSTRQWGEAIAYLEAHTEVRDVLLSGGDKRSAKQLVFWALIAGAFGLSTGSHHEHPVASD